jgi:hypothetical protein
MKGVDLVVAINYGWWRRNFDENTDPPYSINLQ